MAQPLKQVSVHFIECGLMMACACRNLTSKPSLYGVNADVSAACICLCNAAAVVHSWDALDFLQGGHQRYLMTSCKQH
jgi:hypothetical protein